MITSDFHVAFPRRFQIVLALVLLIAPVPGSMAQVPLSGGGYSQSFNSLSTSGTSNPWIDNSTVQGWYASKTAGGSAVTNYRAGTGSDNAGALWSFGDAASTERALGSLCSATPGAIAFGIRFTNDTGFPQTNFLISFTGEQWRNANGSTAVTNILSFSFRVSSLPLTNSDAADALPWTTVPELNFASPIVTTNTGAALNGNLSQHQQVFTNVLLSGLVVHPGHELFLRWRDTDDFGSDAGMAIDNLTVLFTEAPPDTNPPPSAIDAISVLSYNVKGNFATNWSTNSAQIQAIGRQVIYLQPDILTFQEVPRGFTYEMANFVAAYLPGYYLATNSGTDGAIRSAIMSRFPIVRSTALLDGASLTNFGYDGTFTRDLFEAEIAVPGFAQPLHVFTTHLKSGQGTDDSARRSAEAGAISNYFFSGFLTTNSLRPYLLTGDLNEDINRPPPSNPLSIQKLISAPVGLRLTTPLNPISFSDLTHSIQGNLDRRYDYVLPGTLLFSNIVSSQVFRTDLLNPVPPGLNFDDDIVASDHLPVIMYFANPYRNPFHVTSITHTTSAATLTWESVPGQSYIAEQSFNFITWTNFSNAVLATNYSVSFTTNTPVAPQFFRVRRLP